MGVSHENREMVGVRGWFKVRMTLILGSLFVLATIYGVYGQQRYTIPDNIAYLQAGRQVATGGGFLYPDPHSRADARYYHLHSFRVIQPRQNGRAFDYLPGLPLIIAPILRAFGENLGVRLLPVVLGVSAAGVVGLLAWLLFDGWTAILSMLIFGLAPSVLRSATMLWTEIPTVAAVAGAVAALLAASRGTARWKRIVLACLAGLLTITALFLRNVNVVALLPLALVALTAFRKAGRNWDAVPLIAYSILAFAGLVGLGLYTNAYYGSVFGSSYTPLHGWYVDAPFSLAYAFGSSPFGGHSAAAMLQTVSDDFGLLLLLVVPGIWYAGTRQRIILLALLICLAFPYLIYAFPAAGANERFVIAAYVGLVIIMASGASAVLRRISSTPARLGAICVFVALIVWSVPGSLASINARNQGARGLIDQVVEDMSKFDGDSVFLSYALNDIIAVYGGRSVLNYRHMTPYVAAEHRYAYEEYESLLVNEVERLPRSGDHGLLRGRRECQVLSRPPQS